jgi:hypothetical protein
MEMLHDKTKMIGRAGKRSSQAKLPPETPTKILIFGEPVNGG